jgi:hypothetical protein
MRAVAVVVLIGVLLIACASFTDAPASSAIDGGIDGDTTDASSGDGTGAGCAAESCAGRQQCESWSFDTCDQWTMSGDGTATCKNGKLLIQASGTLDAQSVLTLPTPSSSYKLRVAGRIVVNDWDGGRLIALGFAETPIGFINAKKTALGNKIELEFCHSASDCFNRKLVVDAGSEHLFLFEISDAQTKLTVDCVPLATLSGSALETDDSLSIVFGKNDGEPIDGTLDDVVVSYE